MSDHYAVVGYPIAHSKSPLIHRLFAEQTGQDITYEAILIDSDEEPFAAAIHQLRQMGYKGLNVTLPYKLDAFELAQTHTERAQIAQAVNTLIFHDDGTIEGDNTDGAGLVMDIRDLAGFPIAGQRILIIGAGGAVQGVLKSLLDEQPASIRIANRTAARAVALAKRFQQEAIPISGGDFSALSELPAFDLIINGTSASLQGKVPPIPPSVLHPHSLVYDMMYAPTPTPFMQWAQQHQPDCTVRDGLGMLVGQAAESFWRWRHIRPNVADVLHQVRRHITSSG
ncbi:MAG TPA: shikimate dehydrogenase [Piscirickettsiaceae bacterium]|nr:shikimate dehydrogenase [Piscirickettsiaceae bacterium]